MYKKILCVGTNSEKSDSMATDIAQQYQLINRGLIFEKVESIESDGVYHTSLADISSGDVISISSLFDLVIMLDQPRSDWSHWKLLQSTYKIMIELERQGVNVSFKENNNVKRLQQIENMVVENKSWCIYPWINVVAISDQGQNLCARSQTLVTDSVSIDAWKQSEIRHSIQQSMLKGELNPSHCETCYFYESNGIESYRQYESRDWCNQLDIASFDDLDKIQNPKYYEVHWSNKCNLKCRGCVPERSSAIEVEFGKYKIRPYHGRHYDEPPKKYPSVDIIDVDTLDRTSRVYVSGGEPVIMPETIEFMKRCIHARKTDFELTMSTNGVKFPEEFIELSREFTNLNFSFSLDGYREINDYWRSGAQWDKIVNNMFLVKSLGHKISINTVPGIYNVTNMHLLLEWIDATFPGTALYMQINYLGPQAAFNHPDKDAVIKSMERCQHTNVYWSDGKSCRTAIDSILYHYQHNHSVNTDDLREFFRYNDKLDQIRRVSLKDFIPELDACRILL